MTTAARLTAAGLLAMCLLAMCSDAAQKLVVTVGAYSIITGRNIRQAAVSDPKVADLQPISSTEVLVTAMTPGNTQIIVWDARGRREFDVTAIAARPKLDVFASMIEAAIAAPAIRVESVGDKIMLRGEVPSAADQQHIEALAKAVYPNVESLITIKRGCSAEAFAAIKGTLTGLKLTAELSPDGKVIIGGELKNSSELESVKKVLEPWAKDVEFVYTVNLATSPQDDAIEGLNAALRRWRIVASALPDGRVLLQGAVPGKEALAEAQAIVQGWRKTVEIVESISADDSTSAPQVLIRSRVVELDRSYLRDLGVDWTKIVFSQSGGQSTFSADSQPFIIGQPTPGPFPLFGGPPIEQLDPIGARVTALIQQDKAHLLSQPSIVTVSGKSASILIGGEVPIPVPQSGTGGFATITIEYKEFGIRLFVLPTVGENGEIAMLVRPEVSALDYANGIVISGIRVPGFRTRRAESTVHVPSGCSIAIGGLVSKDDIKSIRRLPLLSKIPILGNFFKSVSTTQKDSELLIIVTPEIVGAARPVDVINNTGADLPLAIPPPGEVIPMQPVGP